MYKEVYICPVVKKRRLSASIYEITVRGEELSRSAKCGQFIHIKCGDGQLLRRPISICDTGYDTLCFAFEVRGEGTRFLSKVREGDYLDILGPLGRGFTTKGIKSALCIGGGIGIFPLLKTAKNVEAADIALGFKNKDAIVLEKEFSLAGRNLVIATDDGSYGAPGLVTEHAQWLLKENKYDIIYTCGPISMLKAVVELAKKYNISCEVSLEQRMACGIGACKGCVCKIKNEQGEGSRYTHICSEGPVYKAEEVLL